MAFWRFHIGSNMRSDDKIKTRLLRRMGEAMADFAMIEDGDRVMVCVSGGKDSHTLLDLLIDIRQRAPVNFELLAVNLDQKQPGFPAEVLPAYLNRLEVPFRIVERDTYSIVKRLVREGKTYCSVCSRLRRGILYNIAVEERCNKIALGHHADDMVETLLLNTFFAGALKAMPARLVSDNGRHVVIRPLAYVWEEEARAYAKACELPIIGCCCPACGDLSLQRQRIKRLLMELEREHPDLKSSILKSLGNVQPRHLLDRRLTASRADLKFDPANVTPAPDEPASEEPAAVEPARAGSNFGSAGSVIPLATLRR